MALHVWSVLCSRSIIDQESNNLTLINTIEQIHVQPALDAEFPVTLPIRLEVVTLWARSTLGEPETVGARLLSVGPNDETLHEENYEVDLMNHERSRRRSRFNGLTIGGLGLHYWKVQKQVQDGWVDEAVIPLVIKQMDPEQSE